MSDLYEQSKSYSVRSSVWVSDLYEQSKSYSVRSSVWVSDLCEQSNCRESNPFISLFPVDLMCTAVTHHCTHASGFLFIYVYTIVHRRADNYLQLNVVFVNHIVSHQ